MNTIVRLIKETFGGFEHNFIFPFYQHKRKRGLTTVNRKKFK